MRTCLRDKITRIEDAREILYEEIYRYNYKRIHSTTKEIPVIRYENALEAKKSLFRKFEIKKPLVLKFSNLRKRFKKATKLRHLHRNFFERLNPSLWSLHAQKNIPCRI